MQKWKILKAETKTNKKPRIWAEKNDTQKPHWLANEPTQNCKHKMYKGTTKSENVAAFRLKKRVEHKPIDSESEFRFKYFRDINFKPRNWRIA